MDHGVGSSDPFVLLKFVTVPAFRARRNKAEVLSNMRRLSLVPFELIASAP